jgi:hypothetical protein
MSAPVSVATNKSLGSVSVPSHQAVNLPKHTPKVHYLPVRAGDTNNVWSSSGVFLDFLLPSNIGTLSIVKLRFTLNNTAGAVLAPPTPYWIQQIEVNIGATQIETLYPNDIFNETIGFKNRDELDASDQVLNTNNDYITIDQNIPAGASTYYLPFNNCLTSARLFAAGVTEDVVYRVYFPPNILPSAVKLTTATLVIEEDCGCSGDKSKNLAAHRTGIIYNTVVRQRQQTSFTKASANADMTLDLTGLNGNSAGFIVYAGPAVVPGTGNTSSPYDGDEVPVNTLLNKRYPIRTLELNDQMGAKKTEQLRGEALIGFTWWNHVGTAFPSREYASTYLIPFCSSFRRAVEEGNNYGSLNTDGTDRLVLNAPFANPESASETWVVTITNYIYVQLVFQNGKLLNVIRR